MPVAGIGGYCTAFAPRRARGPGSQSRVSGRVINGVPAGGVRQRVRDDGRRRADHNPPTARRPGYPVSRAPSTVDGHDSVVVVRTRRGTTATATRCYQTAPDERGKITRVSCMDSY